MEDWKRALAWGGLVLMILVWLTENTVLAVENSPMTMNPDRSQSRRVLVIGKVTDNPKKHYRTLKPMAAYAAEGMKDLGIVEAKVLMARDNDQMVTYLREGRVDWVTETLYSAVIFHVEAGAEYLVKKWKKGEPDYRPVFFCRKEAPINTLSDLKGRKLALEDSGSTTAFFYPAVALFKENLPWVRLDSLLETPVENRVSYVFCGQEINISTLVFRGIADAGAFNNMDWERDDHVRAAFRKELRIFYEMPPLPRAIEMVRKDLSPEVKSRLKTLLLSADQDPKARYALDAYQRTTRFEEIDNHTGAELKEVADLLETMKNFQ